MARLRRLYVPELPAAGGGVELPPESLEHVHVLRLSAGVQLELFDAHGRSALAELTLVTRGRAVCEAQPASGPVVRSAGLQLIVCLPKAGKLETIVRMTTELGVRALHLCHSERSVAKGAESGKLERLRRVAREACAQSGQPLVPELFAPTTLAECAARAAPGAHKLLFWEQASAPVPAAVSGEAWAVVGPEGGLGNEEAEMLQSFGYAPISLGTHILRAETACVVITALLLDRMHVLRAADS
jgi:16S rRNA (uracil1498-N3)-methyltransferase